MPLLYLLPPLGAVLIWSGNMTINQLSVTAIAPSAIAFYRWLLALIVLSPFVLPTIWRERYEIRLELPKLALLGLLGMAMWQGLAYVAAETTTATNMGILGATVPLLTVLLSSIILYEAPTLGSLIGGPVALAGVFILLGHGNILSVITLDVTRGDLLMFIAALCYATYGVMLKRWPMSISPWAALYIQAFFASLYLLPVYLIGPMTPIDKNNIALVLYAGIPASIITTYLWMRAIREIGASKASIFFNLLPIFSALIAIAFLDEELTVWHVLGGSLTLTGVIMAQTLTHTLPKVRG